MKKSFTAIAMLLVAACTVCFGQSFNWNVKTAEEAEQMFNSLPNKETFRNCYNNLMTVIGKSPENTTYKELKALCKEKDASITQSIYCVGALQGFVNDVIADPEFANNKYVNYFFRYRKKSDSMTTFQKIDKLTEVILEREYADLALNDLLKVVKDANDDELVKVKASLKKIKRNLYQDIENPKIKAILVKVQLALDSLD
jgi:hypothetical protein